MGKVTALGRVVAVLMCAALAAPATANAAVVRRSSTVRDALGPHDIPSRIEALIDKQLEVLGIPRRFLPFLDDDARAVTDRYLSGEAFPDLNATGSDDVVEIDTHYSYSVGEGQVILESEVDTQITAREGTHGKKIWRKRYGRDAYPIPMRVGAKGRQGVLVISGIWNFFGTTEESNLTFDALDGKTGKRLWRRNYRSMSYYDLATYVAHDVPLMIAIFDGLEGRAQDLLIGLGTFTQVVVTTVAARVAVVDGATGEEHSHPIVDVGIDWLPIALPVGDLDGDKLDDYAVANNLGADVGGGQDPPSFGGTLYTRRGTDGTPLWTTSGLAMEFFAYPRKLPDVVGAGAPEVGLETYIRKSEELVPLPVPNPLPIALEGFYYEPAAYLFDGDDGVQRWRKPYELMYSPGNIDRAGKADLTLVNFRVRFRKNTTSLVLFAVTGVGKALWKRTSTWRFEGAPCPQGLCSGGYGYWFDATPDVQPDRVRDVLFAQSVQMDQAFEDSITRVYDGSNGRMKFQEDDYMQPAYTAIDGRGTDMLIFDPKQGHMDVLARDGAKRPLWDLRIALGKKLLKNRSWFWGAGFELRGDRCGDVVINGSEESVGFYAVVNGADGRVRWSRATAKGSEAPSFQPRRDANRAC